MKRKKGAISLSINILVILIISIFILGLGLSFLYKLMTSGETVKEKLDQETERQLEQLLVKQGEKVALPLNKITLHRGQEHIFGVGVLNIGKINSFRIVITPDKFIDDAGNRENNPANDWYLYSDQLFELAEHDYAKEKILVIVPKGNVKLGTYTFRVDIIDSADKPYGIPLFFTVIVE